MARGIDPAALHQATELPCGDDTANAAPMLSSSDMANAALRLSAPGGANNTAGRTPGPTASKSLPTSGGGSTGIVDFDPSLPSGVSPQFAATWSNLVNSPPEQTWMRQILSGSG